MKLVKKREFAEVALNLEYETFVVYVATLTRKDPDEVHPLKKFQIAYLKANKAPMEISNKVKDFEDVFSLKLAAILPKHSVNNHTIELIDDKQLFCGSIYCLEPVELETLKTYIKNNLASGFI